MSDRVSSPGHGSAREAALMAEIALLRESNYLHEQIIRNSPVAIALPALDAPE